MQNQIKSKKFLNSLKNCGKKVTIFEKAQLVNPHMIDVGDFSQIDDFVWILGGQGVDFGRRVHIASFTSIAGGGKCCIEDYSSVAAGCRIITGSDDFSGNALMNPCAPMEYRTVTRSFVRLEKFSTLATNVIVTPGVTVGKGAIVLAGSIVNKDIDEWSIYMGAPIRKIGKRDASKVEALAERLEKEHE